MTQFTSTYINGTIDEITLASGSIYLNGTSQHLFVPSNANLALGSGDWTIEFWVYLVSRTGQPFFLDQRTADTQYTPCLYSSGNGTGIFSFYVNGADRITASTALSTGQWYHIALCRSSGNTKLFYDGVQTGSTFVDSGTYLSGDLVIGSRARTFDYRLNGYISNYKTTVGRALYPNNFNRPAGPLVVEANTSLLLSVKPSDPFKDYSTNNLTITGNGTPTFTNVGPFNPAPPASGTSQNIPMRHFRDGTIMISGIYDEVSTWNNYVPGLFKTTYVGYFNDVPSWFATATTGTYGANPATSVQTTIIEEPSSDDGSLFSVQWLGYFLPSTTETYTFYTSSDDASYVWVGNTAISGFTTTNAIVNNGGLHATQERSGTIALTAGTYYPIRIQFGENGGGDNMSFNYSTPTITKTTNVTGKVFYNSATNGI